MKFCFVLFFFLFLSLTAYEPLSDLDLLRLYIESENFEKAEEIIQYTNFDPVYQDSLALLKVKIAEAQNHLEKAADHYIEFFHFTKKDSSYLKHTENFKRIVNQLSPSVMIDKVTTAINQTENTEFHSLFLTMLAEIYERNYLFGEAKDVYRVLLQDSSKVDSIEISLKIAMDDIFLQNYDSAIKELTLVLPQADSLQSGKIKFLTFVANYSAGNIESAKTILFDLYENYPEHPEMEDVLEAAAELFLAEKQYLLSWFFWNELYKISSELQQVNILRKINSIKTELLQDSLSIDQFQYFKPTF